jgi:nicotinamidase-related amidase
MVNDFSWDGGEKIIKPAFRAARAISKLKARAAKRNIPAIYANDNFGQWQSDFAIQLRHCRNESPEAAKLIDLIKPSTSDYFVLKPRHSAFYASPLNLLLESIKAKHLVLTGISTESCVLMSSMEAHLRGYEISVPSDCVASADPNKKRQALQLMKDSFGAGIQESSRLRLRK